MPRTSNEAEVIAAYATQTAPPSPPSDLTEEQSRYWIAIVADLPAGYTLATMRNAELGGEDVSLICVA